MRLSRQNRKTSNLERGVVRPAVQGSKFNVQGSRFGPRRGVALIITLIMLSVITFMAVTFLALSRREAGSVTVTRDQTTARLAAETALERVKAEFATGILATTNANNFDLMVSTNYESAVGYDPAAQTIGIPNVTNVNYRHKVGGSSVFTLDERRQNLANLLYNPSPPVFITNRYFANSNEFRFYHDLNRNGRHDTNGFWPELDRFGLPITAISNGITVTNFVHFIGDPEWIGILERPELPHSSSNRFIARYAYIVIPTGKTLDVNYVHNQAKTLPARTEGFLRNQGVAPWEINLAAFLVDLNTNMWLVASPQGFGSPHVYDPLLRPNGGAGFDDAFRLLRYRYGGASPRPDYPQPVSTLFGGPGITAFGNDFVDGYTGGPLMTTYWGWQVPTDRDTPRTGAPWSGGDPIAHFFTTQDFYDRSKASLGLPTDVFGLTDRLKIAGTNTSSYDRYTFYRLLAQLGTDSAPESGKLNLNWKNVGGLVTSNFVAWTPDDFFTNAADKLLTQYTREWNIANPALFLATYGTNQPFGVASIPVRVNSNFVYTPSVHRLMQMAANIADAQTNRLSTYGADLPSVFRPVVRSQGSNVYVVGYTSVDRVSGSTDPQFTKPLDLNNPVDLALVPPMGTPPLLNDVNVYGVPWVIGAKKGLPNFNEFAMQTVFQLTRKLEVRRSSLSAPQSTWRTNLQYSVGITNIIGVEAWNSYRTNFNRAVDIIVANDLSMALTNNFWPTGIRKNLLLTPPIGIISIPATQPWPGYYVGTTNSFLVPLRTNLVFLQESAYHFTPPNFTTDPALAWETSQTFPQPQWGLSVTNKLRFIILDKASGRVIDYVQLDNLIGMRDLSEEIRDPDDAQGFDGLWSTNLVSGNLPWGILNQIFVAFGNYESVTTEWTGYGLNQPSGTTKDYAIDYFRALYGLSELKTWPNSPLVNTSLVQQVPFTPTKRISQYLTWQANDPLVHYTAGDLAYLPAADSIIKESLKVAIQPIKNIGKLNDRYEPWGGNPQKTGDPNAFNIALKDPAVRSSDDWQFLTNKFPSIGWLGRVHRGTPWQTIYMKASDVPTNLPPTDPNLWQAWTGNRNYNDAMLTRPMSDRILFDVFTTAFNENASRGQLSVNQSGLAAWSAVFSGVVAFTNRFPNLAQSVTNYPIAFIEPARGYNPFNTNTWPPLVRMVEGINRERARTNSPVHPAGSFRHVGDILSVPELTDASPYLNVNINSASFKNGLNDAVYEWLPQQVMGLLRLGEPRFVVYSYGQTLRPAPASIITASGPFNGMVTNYQVTAEMATRAVLRIENAPTGPTPTRPRVVIENFNLLPPD